MFEPSVWISIIALILSVLAVVLTSMKEGIGLALGFRESETTSRQQKKIREALEKEAQNEISKFLEENRDKKKTDPQMKEAISEIARNDYYTTLGDDLLEEMTNASSRFLRGLFVTVVMALMVVFLLMYSTDSIVPVVSIIYVIFPFYTGYATAKNAYKYYYLRLTFQRLADDPTFDTCDVLDDWLKTKGISF
jgi:Flp pilus assembly protein TadB